ncbi:Fanconi anemia group I protein [Paragonimus heterotremus]|uniref:Fanconi anemia group I protein n=1 Tax=Paragonimus heterotremus TaxID=100268 RepID=A0A8J4TEZ0_9TREM|nr:Fanconi anemia group I protein [Paragonimus heterotremus]
MLPRLPHDNHDPIEAEGEAREDKLMEEELILHIEDTAKVKSIVTSKRFDEIIALFDDLLLNDESETGVSLIEAVTYGVYEHEELLEICESLLDRVWVRCLPNIYRSSISLFLNSCVECLEDWKLERLCIHVINKLSTDSMEPGCIFDTFGKALSRLENSTVLLTPLIEPLCNTQWSYANTLSLIECLKDYPFTVQFRKAILQKTLSDVSHWESHMIPPILNAAMGFSCSKTIALVLDHLRVYFQHIPTGVKANVLSQIFDRCQESEQFALDILDSLKNLSQTNFISDFTCTLLLTILPIKSVQSQALRLLNSAILTAFADTRVILESSFLRGLCDVPDDPTSLILNICQQCASQSVKHTSYGLILLGFELLRTATMFSACNINRGSRLSAKLPKPIASPFLNQRQVNTRISRLATEILIHLFKNCAWAREDIMNVIANVLWSESSKPVALKLVDLLSDLVATCPSQLAVLVGRLDVLLDSIGLIPIELFTGLVHALLPLIRAGNWLADVRDVACQTEENPMNRVRAKLFVNLRKASSSPRIQSRRTAVACFLLLLKHLKVSVSSFRSASQHSSSSGFSQSIPSTQLTQNNPSILYTQLQSTQIIQQAITLPCDMAQNEAICTEIVGMLHRVIFSAFFRSQAGSLLEDPGSRVKSDIYWGLCEVASRNKGLFEPVLNLYLRLLLTCLSSNFVRELKRNQPLASLTFLTVLEPSQQPLGTTGPAVCLDDLIQLGEANPSEIRHTEHPDILFWCLQLVLTQPSFASSWRHFRARYVRTAATGENSESSQSTNGFSQFTQSTVTSGSVECGRPVSSSLFSKAVILLLALSDSLRSTPLDDFALTANLEFGSTPTGKVNRERAELLLGLYDACLEFELKDPLELVSARGPQATETNNLVEAGRTRIRQLFARRLALSNLLGVKVSNPSNATSGSLLLPTRGHRGQPRPGLLILSLISAAQSGLARVLRASSTSDGAGALAYHLLHTIATRLQQFTHCHAGGIPYAYRDPLVQTMVPILRHVIRYYDHKLLYDFEPAALRGTDTNVLNTTTNPTTDATNQSRSRGSSSNTPSAAALSVLDVAFTLALDLLNPSRLHRLTVQLYTVTSDPTYRHPQSDIEPNEMDCVDDDNEAAGRADVSPAQALSTLIKLIKGWITKLLGPFGGQPLSSTQRSSVPHSAHTKDLVILLPLLVRLCRARATIGSEELSTRTTVNTVNPYAGLDRVLAWLIRLMRHGSSPPLSVPKSKSDACALLVSARVQLVGQAIWLAHLVGPCPSSGQTGRTDVGSEDPLSLEYLLTTLSSDLHLIFGDALNTHNTSFLTDDSDTRVTFPIVTRSSAISLLSLILSFVRQLLDEFTWLLNQLSAAFDGRATTDVNNAPRNAVLASSGREEALCLRLISFGQTLASLLQSAIPVPSAHVDSVLDISAQSFNFLTQLVKYYLRIVRSRSGRFPVLFERVIRVFGRLVSPNAYSFISYIQHAEAEKVKSIQDKQPLKKTVKDIPSINQKQTSKKTSHATLPQALISRSIKDSRVIPQLIFAIEQFERFLLQLSKLSKVNLMQNVKLAVSRDFRINAATVVAQLERSAALSVSSDSDDDQPSNVSESPPGVVAPSSPAIFSTPDNLPHLPTSETEVSVVELRLSNDGSQNQPPGDVAQQLQSETPAWGRAVLPSSARQSILKRTVPSTDAPCTRAPKIPKLTERNR